MSLSNKTKTKKSGRPSFRDSFLEKLSELSGGEQKLISNATVREGLGWDENRYGRVKSQLLEEKLIIAGRGQGGTVGLATAPGSRALTIFISYSHTDEELKNALLKHLEPLKRLKLIETWHDRKLKPGDDIKSEVSDNLENSDIVLLLVSIDFINSAYCYDVELEKALELQAAGKIVIIPVILRNCLWQHTPFSKLLALPKDGKAVKSWADQEEALVNVADGIRAKAQEILDAT